MSEQSLSPHARAASLPADKELLADAVEEALARLRAARPHLEGRIDRAAGYLVVQLSSASSIRPIRCRIRKNGKRVYLVASMTSPGVVYAVDPSGWSCTCRDFFRNGLGCKHSLAGYVLAKITVPSPGTPPEPDEDGAQGDDGGGDEPEASGGQEEPTYEQVGAWLTAQKWITAKTRPENPHQYCLKRNAKDPLLGNVSPLLAYPLNTCNGFLVTILIAVARFASSLPFATSTTPGVTPHLVALFYAACVPIVAAGRTFRPETRPLWAAPLLVWTTLWLVLVGSGSL